jgi:hypothetical protein
MAPVERTGPDDAGGVLLSDASLVPTRAWERDDLWHVSRQTVASGTRSDTLDSWPSFPAPIAFAPLIYSQFPTAMSLRASGPGHRSAWHIPCQQEKETRTNRKGTPEKGEDMKRYRWGSIALLTPFLVLVLDRAVARSSAPAAPVRTEPGNTPGRLGRRPGADRIDRLPIIRALTPEDVLRQKEAAARSRLFRPVVPEREAILPDPSDGRELVNRYVATGSGRPTGQIVPARQTDGLAQLLKSTNLRNR